MGGHFKRADKIQININPLAAVVAAPLALMDNDFLYKLIEHGRCQLGKVGVAAHKFNKAVCF